MICHHRHTLPLVALMLLVSGCGPLGRPSADEIRAMLFAQNPPRRLGGDGKFLGEVDQRVTIDQVLEINNAVLVLYHTPSAQGYIVLQRRLFQWQPTESAWTADAVRDGVVTYQYDSVGGGDTTTEVVLGRVSGAEATAVRVTFGNGEVVRQDVLDGMFAIARSGLGMACTLQVIGHKLRVIRDCQIDKITR